MENGKPLVSIITPTHRVDYLGEAWESLKRQTATNWEWVLVPNNGAVIPEEIAADSRVRICPFEEKKIGALKKYACSQAQGKYIIEFDHDDILMPTAVDEVVKAFDEDVTRTFVYSNTVEFRDTTWEPYTYGAQHGWRYRPFEYEGHPLQEAIAFEPMPASIGYIWYAPNHLRAWTKEAYDRIGGHNADMEVIDDHELMCRFYLDGIMYHIDKPLYLYRVYQNNTWLEKNALIQKETRRIYSVYIYRLIERWCDMNKLPKIDLGSNRGTKPAGYIGVDIRGSDITADLNGRWPFEDNSVGVIRAFDTLEHLPDKIHSMNEAHRVLAPGGVLLFMTPSSDGRGAYQDPTHNAFWNINSLWYHTKRQYANFVPEITSRFQPLRAETFFPSKFHKDNDISYVLSELVAIKPGYERPDSHIPGIIEI